MPSSFLARHLLLHPETLHILGLLPRLPPTAPWGFQPQPFLWRAACFASPQCFGVPVSWISLLLVDPLLSVQGNVDWSVEPDWPPAVRERPPCCIQQCFLSSVMLIFYSWNRVFIDIDAWFARARSQPTVLQCYWDREGSKDGILESHPCFLCLFSCSF